MIVCRLGEVAGGEEGEEGMGQNHTRGHTILMMLKATLSLGLPPAPFMNY